VARTLRTPIYRELGIDYPIFSVGFAVSAGPELVGAVSGAGGCRVLGGSVVTEIKLAAQIVRDLAREAEIALAGPSQPRVGSSPCCSP
jgi:NAD(P)H-dependent flavin oxidoreductase YrpB (nitropropane dioxygenase family)